MSTSYPSIFQSLQKYTRTPGRNPREDRLTEALAVTLNRAPDAARFLVRKLFTELEVPTKSRAEARTQVWTRRGRVDLALVFGAENGDLLVWFENKVDAPPEAEQGKRYIEELKAREEEGRCATWGFGWILKRKNDLVDPPAAATVGTWQTLGEHLREWLVQGDHGEPDEHGRWFVEQFLDHLEKEEFLAITEPLGHDDIEVLAGYDVARSRMRGLAELVDHEVKKQWGDFPEAERTRLETEVWGGSAGWWLSRPNQDVGFWFTYPAARRGTSGDWPRDWYFQIVGGDDRLRQAPEGKWVFGAGLAFGAPREQVPDGFYEWVKRLLDLGFESGEERGPYAGRQVGRYLTLDEMFEELGGDGIRQQARRLADWAVEAFDELNRVPMPQAP